MKTQAGFKQREFCLSYREILLTSLLLSRSLWRWRVSRPECEDRRRCCSLGPASLQLLLTAGGDNRTAAGLGLYYVTGASNHAVATIETSILYYVCQWTWTTTPTNYPMDTSIDIRLYSIQESMY